MREQCDISKVANPVTFLKWGDTAFFTLARLSQPAIFSNFGGLADLWLA